MDKIKVLYLPQDDEYPIHFLEITPCLESYQKLVDGWFELVYVGDYILVVNEEGLLRDDLDWNTLVPYIRGNIFVVKDIETDEGGDFGSVDETDLFDILSAISDYNTYRCEQELLETYEEE